MVSQLGTEESKSFPLVTDSHCKRPLKSYGLPPAQAMMTLKSKHELKMDVQFGRAYSEFSRYSAKPREGLRSSKLLQNSKLVRVSESHFPQGLPRTRYNGAITQFITQSTRCGLGLNVQSNMKPGQQAHP